MEEPATEYTPAMHTRDGQGSNYGGQRRAGEEANLTTRAAEPGESGEEKPAMEEQQSEAET